jgi:hypothetical protein
MTAPLFAPNPSPARPSAPAPVPLYPDFDWATATADEVKLEVGNLVGLRRSLQHAITVQSGELARVEAEIQRLAPAAQRHGIPLPTEEGATP